MRGTNVSFNVSHSHAMQANRETLGAEKWKDNKMVTLQIHLL